LDFYNFFAHHQGGGLPDLLLHLKPQPTPALAAPMSLKQTNNDPYRLIQVLLDDPVIAAA
jgi:hypothetical protein